MALLNRDNNSSLNPDNAHLTPKSERNRIGLRVVVLSVLLAPATAWWTVDQPVDVIFSLMVPPVVMTMLVAILSMGIRRVAPRYAFTERELITLYAMHTVLSAICAEWLMVIQPYIYSFAMFKDGDTRIDRFITPYAHPWFFMPPEMASKLEDFRNGGRNFTYFLTKLPLWLPFIASWTVLVSLVGGAMLCINSLMRDQWNNREKLAFPIIQVPMEIVRIGGGTSKIIRSPYFRASFLMMLCIDLLNGAHFFYPNLPYINLRFIGDLQQYFPSPPLNAIGWTPIGIFPYMAVIGFFMPTDLLFSCLFFYFFRKFTQIFTYAIGYTESAGTFGGGGLVPGPPYFSEQSWGAFIGLFFAAAMVARPYLREVWRNIRKNERPENQVPPRWAFFGLLFCLVGLCVIGFIIGIPLWMMMFSVFLFLIFSVALTRLRAQLGAPSHEMAFMGPNQVLVDLAGTGTLSTAGISRMVTTLLFFNRIHRTHPMPHQLEAMKMGETAKINQRSLFVLIALAMVLGSVLGHSLYIYRGYRFAAPRSWGESTGTVSSLLERYRPTNPVALLFIVLGFAMVLGLDFIRFRFPGFPLHPAGYALAMNFGLDYFWFGLLIVWLVKLFIERYYGLKGHSKLHEIACGIIFAEFLCEGGFSLYSMMTRTAAYSISINGRLGWNQ